MSPIKQNCNEVFVTFCVDTEGPLYESTEAKFERLSDLYGIRGIEFTDENLEKLKIGSIDLGGIEQQVTRTLSDHLSKYNESWDQINEMLDRVTSTAFRESHPDSYGNGWIYNWFCLDHVGYKNNPRRRALGFNVVYDHYFN